MPKSSNKEVGLLHDVAKAFAESWDLQTTLQWILKSLDGHLKLQRGIVNLLDAETETINIKVAHGFSDESIRLGSYKIGEGITGTVVGTGKEVIVPDIDKDPRFLGKTGADRTSDGKRRAFYCVPIKIERKTIGTLSVDREPGPRDSVKETVRILNIIATMIALAVSFNRKLEEQRHNLEDENLKLRQQLKSKFNVGNMIGTSNAIKEVFGLIEQVAHSNATVLIRGESGTGKDLVAHAIHYNSLRSEKPFIKVNCTALPETLLESELFGHEKGSFTGATERKIGRFERANGGTIFLDEIGDFSLNLQVKLLRVMQFKEFERLGGNETIKSNVRIVVATNKNLEEEIKNGLFREDLYYRINVFPIFLPPLRDRKDDIMLLGDFFLERYAKENAKFINRISTPAIEMLTSYHWPGNIRELENCVERAVLLCNDEVIRSEHLPPSLQTVKKEAAATGRTLPEMVENLEKEMIVESLKKVAGQQRKAAKSLGLTERMLGYKIKKYHIFPKQLA